MTNRVTIDQSAMLYGPNQYRDRIAAMVPQTAGVKAVYRRFNALVAAVDEKLAPLQWMPYNASIIGPEGMTVDKEELRQRFTQIIEGELS